MVKDIRPGAESSGISEFYKLNDTLYFSADDGSNGRELWQSDGTAEGTLLVQDIAPGSSGSDPARLTNANGTLYFAADDGVHGQELWAIAGSGAVYLPLVVK